MTKDKKTIIKWVNDLIDLMEARSLGELEIDSGGERVKLSRGLTGAQTVVASPFPAPEAAAVSGDGGGAEEDLAAHPGAVKSPIVGTAYLSPQPGAKSFAEIGEKITQGQTLLIVEAMKVMNPIQAHKSGTLSQLSVDNGDPVEYGQVLAIIE